MRTLALLFVVALLTGCAGPASGVHRGCDAPEVVAQSSVPAALENVTFATGDGVQVQGWWGPGSNDHVVVLVHGLNEDHTSYDALVAALRARGFTTLAFDLRGHGASTHRGNASYVLKDFGPDDFHAMALDVDAAVEIAHGRGNPACLAVVGASVGANLALREAVAHPGTAKVAALLSPGLDYRGITTDDAAPKYGARPVWMAASTGDSYAADSVKSLSTAFPQVTTMLEPGDLHGTNLLRLPSVQQRLVDWLVAAA